MTLRQAKKLCRRLGWSGGNDLEAWRHFRPAHPRDYHAETLALRSLRRWRRGLTPAAVAALGWPP